MMNVTVKRVGVLSLAKIFGLITFVIGLVIGVIYGLVIMLVGSAMLAQMGGDASGAAALGGVFIGLAVMIGLPLFYGGGGLRPRPGSPLLFYPPSGLPA